MYPVVRSDVGDTESEILRTHVFEHQGQRRGLDVLSEGE